MSRRPGVFWDRALWLIPLIGLIAAWPLLSQPLPSTDDGAQHLLRLVEVDRCLRHGVLPLRWAPDLAHGYGYPGFNFYMNMPTLVAELWHLAGLDFAPAIAATMVMALLLSGWGAYLLGRDVWDVEAGLTAATAYMYAPYQFFDILYRGNLPEAWALGLLPWLLWTGRRVVLRRTWSDVAVGAGVCAALIWTHNIFAAIGLTVWAAYLALLWQQQGRRWSDTLRLLALSGLALALSAFFWLPAIGEVGWTRYSSDLFDYREHFLLLNELLAWPPQLDLSRLNPYPPRSLSWGALLWSAGGAVVSLAALFQKRRPLARPMCIEGMFYAGVFLLAAWLPLSAAGFLWQAIKPLQIAQMPWRFLGLAALMSSLLAGWSTRAALNLLDRRRQITAGAALNLLDRRRRITAGAALNLLDRRRRITAGAALNLLDRQREILVGLALTWLIGMGIPWTWAAPFPQPQNPGVTNLMGWEYGTGLIGGTSNNEFLPVWASGVPDEPADPALLTEHDPIIARLDAAALPAGAQILSARYGLMNAEIEIETPLAFRAVYKQFYFPGWQVLVDGRPTPLIVTPPYGLLGFEVPAGRHTIVVQPTTTPLRQTGETLSMLALLVTAGLMVIKRRAGQRTTLPASAFVRPGRFYLTLAAWSLALLAIKLGLVDRTENLFRARRFDGQRIAGVSQKAQINFGGQLMLRGYDLGPARSGEPLRLDMYLSALGRVDGNYMAYARLVDDEGRLWSLPDNGTPREFRPPPPTHAWPTDRYGHWAYWAYVLPGTPPGRYWIEVGVFERGTWRGLNVLDEQGHMVGISARIGPVEIARAARPPALDTLNIEHPLNAPMNVELTLLGLAGYTSQRQGGDSLDLTLFWQADRQPAQDNRLQIWAASNNERVLLGDQLPLGQTTYPTSSWRKGESVRGLYHLRVPAAMQAGPYVLQALLIDAQGRPVGQPVTLGPLQVAPTERLMRLPDAITHRVEANLGGQVTLMGGDVSAADAARLTPGQILTVTLYWQARQEMETSYQVFVQLTGPGGLLAQSDAAPAGGGRPTTGWMVGEVVIDRHCLTLPPDTAPGTYQLLAGMYRQDTFQRLTVQDQSGHSTTDAIVLTEIVVENAQK